MITIDNYFQTTSNISISTLPDTLQKGHEFVLKVTKNGSSWTSYHGSDAIKKTIDLYLSKISEYLSNKNKVESKQSKQKDTGTKKSIQTKVARPKKSSKQRDTLPTVNMVERVTDDIRFIRRFANLDGKTKTKEEVLRFINALQKAILEKRIRKSSTHAEHIRMIQKKLIDMYNSMRAKIKIEIKPETFETLKKLIGGERVMSSVSFIKSYINLNGKQGMKKKADQLLQRITKSVDQKRIPADDPYMDELIQITKNLESFLNTPSQKTLSIEPNELNGLNGILGCACNPLNGIESKPAIMNSIDFANLEFKTIGLQGKWRELIGDPSSNFTAMVYGKPKMGKSYLSIDFAGHMARNHGKVLYVAKEEGLDMTLQKKLNDKDVAHPNLFVASVLPENLSAYDFIFLDSVNKLGLEPKDLNELRTNNPSKSFVFIFQSTKTGNFRGANSFQHDVDVVIEVPEKGKAVQFGRFNQGGEMFIF